MPRISKASVDNALKSNMDLLSQAVDILRPDPQMPPICEFVESDKYLGLELPLYPNQRAILKLIMLEIDNMNEYELNVINEWADSFSEEGVRLGVSPDVWKRVKWLQDRQYPHFKEIINITGRRGSKGYLGAILGAYQAYRMIRLGDPQDYYGISSDKDLYLYVAAQKFDQAVKNQFADVSNLVIGAPCFRKWLDPGSGETAVFLRTPADLAKIAELSGAKINLNRRIASVRMEAIPAAPSAVRGSACFMAIYDEFAHIEETQGPDAGDKLYQALDPALKQFKRDAITYIPTSPYTQIGAAYKLYEHSLERSADDEPLYGNMLMLQMTSWQPYEGWDQPEKTGVFFPEHFPGPPQEYDEEMKMLERREPRVFQVENMSQWAQVVDAFLEAKKVDDAFKPFYDGKNVRTLEQNELSQIRYVYRSHIDPSEARANAAMIIAHAEEIPDENGEVWYHVIVDRTQVWKPEDYTDHVLDWKQIFHELTELYVLFPTLEKITFDQFGSILTISTMKDYLRTIHHKAIVGERKFSRAYNSEMYQRLYSALGAGWVHLPKDDYGPNDSCLLEQEMKFLQTQANGKISHPHSGAIQSDDMVDCYDEQTEVLTKEGWKLFKDVRDGEEVGTYNMDTQKLEFQLPLQRIDKFYEGDMIEYLYRRVHFKVTPSHRMITKTASQKEWTIKTAESLNPKSDQILKNCVGGYDYGNTQSILFHRAFEEPAVPFSGIRGSKGGKRILWTEEENQYLLSHYEWEEMPIMESVLQRNRDALYAHARKLSLKRPQSGLVRHKDLPPLLSEAPIVPFAGLIGFWLAEGSKHMVGYNIKITQTKIEGQKYIEQILNDLQWSYRTAPGSHGSTEYLIRSKELKAYCDALVSGKNKIDMELSLPKNCLDDWPKEALEELLYGLVMGDGNISPDGSLNYLYNSSKQLLNETQALLIRIGLNGKISRTKKAGDPINNFEGYFASRDMYSLNIEKPKAASLNPAHMNRVFYSGRVYCFTVPNGTLVVRRNNVPMVCGNCLGVIVYELLEDNYRRKQTRKRLGETRIQMGAQGGYHSSKDDEALSPARQKLLQISRGRSTSRPLYNGMSHRFNSRER